MLLPGVSRLARLVARVREETTQRLWDTLWGLLNPRQRRLLDRLVEVPAGARISDLERWRRSPTKASGPVMIKALERVAEIVSRLGTPVELAAKVPAKKWTKATLNCRGKTVEALVWSQPVLWYDVAKHHMVLLVVVRDPTGHQPDDFFFYGHVRIEEPDVPQVAWLLRPSFREGLSGLLRLVGDDGDR